MLIASPTVPSMHCINVRASMLYFLYNKMLSSINFKTAKNTDVLVRTRTPQTSTMSMTDDSDEAEWTVIRVKLRLCQM